MLSVRDYYCPTQNTVGVFLKEILLFYYENKLEMIPGLESTYFTFAFNDFYKFYSPYWFFP